MKINDFKIVRNRQRPTVCYAYEKYTPNKDKKYSIFTMDGGRTFLVSIISKNNSGKLVDTDLSKKVNSIDEALQEFKNFEQSK